VDYIKLDDSQQQDRKGMVYLLIGGINGMILRKLDLDQERLSDSVAFYPWNKPMEAFTGCFIRKLFRSAQSSAVDVISVAVGGSQGISIYEFNVMAPSQGFQKKITLNDHRKNSFIMSLKSSKYHHILVSGAKDGLISVWNLNNGRVIHHLAGEGYSDCVRTLDLCEKVSKKSMSVEDQIIDTYIISGSDDAFIRIYDFNTGKLVRALKHDHHGALISSVRVSHSTNHLCTVTINGSIHLYDISTLGQTTSSQLEQAEFQSVLTDCGSMWDCAFSEDDKNVYFSHDKGIAQMSQ